MPTFIRSTAEDQNVLKLIKRQFLRTDAANQIPKATYKAYANLSTLDDLNAAKATLLTEFNRLLTVAITATAGTITIDDATSPPWRMLTVPSYPTHSPTYTISGVIPNLVFQYFGITLSNVTAKTFGNVPVGYCIETAFSTPYYNNLWNIWLKVTDKITRLQYADEITATKADAVTAYTAGKFTNQQFADYLADPSEDGFGELNAEANRVYKGSVMMLAAHYDGDGNVTSESAGYVLTSGVFADAFADNFSVDLDDVIQASTGWWLVGTTHDVFLTPQLHNTTNFYLQSLLEKLGQEDAYWKKLVKYGNKVYRLLNPA